jgi:hypothetical protein
MKCGHGVRPEICVILEICVTRCLNARKMATLGKQRFLRIRLPRKDCADYRHCLQVVVHYKRLVITLLDWGQSLHTT